MGFSEVLLGLRQSIACNTISQQDLNLIIQYPEARETLRDAFGTLNAEQINRRLNEAEMSITTNDAGEHQLEIVIHRGESLPRVLKMAFPPAQLQLPPEPELTQSPPIHEHERPLPPFDPTIERIAPARHSEALSDAIASGEVEVARESVSIEEVLAKIEALQKEVIDEH